MSEPKVSIIMGIYNCEKMLPSAIDSVLRQTYPNWELIMCDDGSSDATFNVANYYAEKYPDKIIVLKNKKNCRLAATLNHCLTRVTGKYVARMDADDENMPERLEVQVEFLENHPDITCVGTGMIIFDDEGVRGERYYNEYPNHMTMVHRTPFPHPTIMMRREAFDSLGGYTVSKDTLRAEDIDLWFRFYNSGYKGYVIQRPLYRYRESLNDFTKRNLKAAVGTAKVYFRGYRMLNYPFFVYPYALKPIISALVPNGIMQKYHTHQDNRKVAKNQ